jgi:hypothetical protein
MVAVEIIVVDLMLCRVVAVLIVGFSTVLLKAVAFGVLQRGVQGMLGIVF